MGRYGRWSSAEGTSVKGKKTPSVRDKDLGVGEDNGLLIHVVFPIFPGVSFLRGSALRGFSREN